MAADNSKIIYTLTDEAPALATAASASPATCRVVNARASMPLASLTATPMRRIPASSPRLRATTV